jgi:multidrug efflux pump subunit AcrA (membrane-fusion protein)
MSKQFLVSTLGNQITSNFRRIPKWVYIVILLITITILIILLFRDANPSVEVAAPALVVIETVEKGEVSTGISASGTIIAQEKLNLNIYRQQHRIEYVGISSGAQVQKGQLLFSFDDDDISLRRREFELARNTAVLELKEIQETSADPSSMIRTLNSDIVILEKELANNELDKTALLHDFFSMNLEARPAYDSLLIAKSAPEISGRYNSSQSGRYLIEFYKSASDSGFAFSVSGLERATYPVNFNRVVALGNRGLRIVVPDDIASGDKWEVQIPNIFAPNYAVNAKKYKDSVSALETSFTTKSTELANKRKELTDQSRKDTTVYKSLDRSKAELQLQQATLDIQDAITQQKERHIKAPFSGTIEGVDNIVIGATPTGQDNDSMNFGTLISNQFEVVFSLDAQQVSTIETGQEVMVSISTGIQSVPIPAIVTAISSLPESNTVPKYTVQALLTYKENKTKNSLREGMLADVLIVGEKKSNVTRVPVTALEFRGKQATLQVVPTLTAAQESAMSEGGVVSTDNSPLQTLRTEVELGLVGDFFAEIISGVEVGDKILL